MKDELEKEFTDKYPKLFKHHRNVCGERESKAIPPIWFGLECADGWYSILAEAFEKLSKFDVEIFQVKEKFGGLRIYVDDKPLEYAKEIGDIIHAAEEKAWDTCEYCGKPGERRGGGWLKTLCDECEGKRHKAKE